MTYPFDEFDLICDYPFPDGAYAELRRYIRTVNEFLPHASAQKEIRIRAQIKSEEHPVTIGELESELESIKHDDATVLPRLVWGGVMVSIFAAFEYGIRQALKYWQISTKHQDEFKVLPRKDFLRSAQEYAANQIHLPLFESQAARATLQDLKSFRNSFAHGSGLIDDLPEALVASIKSRAHLGVTLEIEDGQWVGNARSAAYYLLHSERAIKTFGDKVFEACLAYHRANFR